MDILGYRPVDLLGKLCYDFYAKEDVGFMMENYNQVIIIFRSSPDEVWNPDRPKKQTQPDCASIGKFITKPSWLNFKTFGLKAEGDYIIILSSSFAIVLLYFSFNMLININNDNKFFSGFEVEGPTSLCEIQLQAQEWHQCSHKFELLQLPEPLH